MPKNHIKHVRIHAKKHEKAHLKLKTLLNRPLYKEEILGIFILSFGITVVSLIIFLNWGKIDNWIKKNKIPKKQEEVSKHEEWKIKDNNYFNASIFSNYGINGQMIDYHIKKLQKIPNNSYEKGLITSKTIGEKEVEIKNAKQNAFISSILLTTNLSEGYHTTSVREAKNLQKSIVSTYYLGEKTIDINSNIEIDARLLSRIKNTLSVDLFHYLNQSNHRSDSLDNFIRLLEKLKEKSKDRQIELKSRINFLEGNMNAKENSIKITEKTFFKNLDIFDGKNAKKNLKDFIGLEKGQSEIRAKVGAYKGIQSYYEFFNPKLDNLLRAIKANRDPLIAGVKVVEIQNMTLPLIIKER